MTKNLTGKSVLVTGASAGIGRACVNALVGEGASVLATGRRKDELDALSKEHGDAVQTIVGDLNDGAFVTKLADAAQDVDIMVSNAGILTYAPLMDMTFEDTEAMFLNRRAMAGLILSSCGRSIRPQINARKRE